MQADGIPQLLDLIDPTTLRVQAPSSVIFVCGGKTDIKSAQPLSLRDAFMRFTHEAPFSKHSIFLAEAINAFAPKDRYKDLLQFEADIAQISELVLLFSESAGSFAELGAFAVFDEISMRLLVVVDDYFYNEDSFIRWGPLLSLEQAYGDPSTYVLDRAGVGIDKNGGITGLNLPEFKQRMKEAIEARLSTIREASTFDPTRSGHLIKVVVGLVQHYGALTIEELEAAFTSLGIALGQDKLAQCLLSAEAVGWIGKTKAGIKTFYGAKASGEAMYYTLKPGAPLIDKLRWRADLAAYWRKNDAARFRSIQANLSAPVVA